MATVGELAASIPGAEAIGDASLNIERLVHPVQVNGGGDLFLIMDNGFAARVAAGGMVNACALVDSSVWKKAADTLRPALAAAIVAPRPRYALARLSRFFSRRTEPMPEIHLAANIDPTAEIGDGCSIAAGVFVGADVKVGRGTVLYPNVVLGEGSVLGDRCRMYSGVCVGDGVIIGSRVIIHPNAVIGSDGFAFDTPGPNVAEAARHGDVTTRADSQPWERIESFGTVRIGDDVEIGAGSTIDRATFGETVIESGVKIDNLVQIGHNCRIGENTLLCAHVGLAGSTSVGHDSVLAGKVGVADHLEIGPHTVLMAKSGVTRNLDGNTIYYGMPARPVKDTLRIYALQGKLVEMKKQIAELERRLADE